MLRLAFLLALLSAPFAGAAQSIAITDVRVIDVARGRATGEVTVLVSGDRISGVGPSTEIPVPGTATVVDGKGKFLIPGLWDMHVHTSTDRVTREVLFPLFVAHGVTGIRSMSADCFTEGEPNCVDPKLSEPLPSIRTVTRWRAEMAAGALVGPRVYAGSANLDGPGPDHPSTPQNPGTPEDARAHVGILRERGLDFIKVYSEFPGEAYFALVDEALAQGLPVAGHVPIEVRASAAARAGQRGIDHIGPGNELEECSTAEEELRARLLAALSSEDGVVLPVLQAIADSYDPARCAEVFRTLVDNGTWVVPTLLLARLPSEIQSGWPDDPRVRFLAADERAVWNEWGPIYDAMLGTPEEQEPYSRWIRRVAREMHEVGVQLLPGTDAGYPGVYWGSTVHEELRLLASIGMTNAEVLRAATLGAAEATGSADAVGSIRAGKAADLVLLDANPLDDLANTERIAGVVLRGRLFDRAALDSLLESAERAARQSDRWQ